MLSLLYVSDSRLGEFAPDELSAIVAIAVRKNLQRSVTGALAFTGTHFAQVLEGPDAAVSEIMEAIGRDPRHSNIRVVRAVPQTERRFPNWGMTLVDAGPNVTGLVGQALASDSAEDWIAERLISEMERGASASI